MCWSATIPQSAGDRASGTDINNALDNAIVGFSNWMNANTVRVYSDDQVNRKLEVLRKEFSKKENALEQRIHTLEQTIDALSKH